MKKVLISLSEDQKDGKLSIETYHEKKRMILRLVITRPSNTRIHYERVYFIKVKSKNLGTCVCGREDALVIGSFITYVRVKLFLNKHQIIYEEV